MKIECPQCGSKRTYETEVDRCEADDYYLCDDSPAGYPTGEVET